MYRDIFVAINASILLSPVLSHLYLGVAYKFFQRENFSHVAAKADKLYWQALQNKVTSPYKSW